jgi:flagellar L-ring protein precursor FlgH
MRLRVLMLSVLGTAGAAMGQQSAVTVPPREPAADRQAAAAQQAYAPSIRAEAQQQHEQQHHEQQPNSLPPERTARFGSDDARPPLDAAALLRNNGNSLLKASLAAGPDPSAAQLRDVSLHAVPIPEPRVIKKHDLVTIIVREESQFSSEGTGDVKREASIDAAIEDFIKLKLHNWEIEGGAIGPQPPRIAGHLNREFKGEGTVDRSDRFTARVTAEVLDVKPNGTLVLQARKRIKTDDEEQTLTLSGTCRAQDITADNTVLSTALHDQELIKTTKGAVRDATRRGWAGKLLDAVSPF